MNQPTPPASTRRRWPWWWLAVLGAAALVDALLLFGGAPGTAAGAKPRPAAPAPLPKLVVIAHRGASGYLPEHTLAGYRLAAELGADYLEPDLAVTSDGVLVCRHENELSATTDVASRPEFAALRRRKVLAGRPVTGWFTEDFTLAQLRTLRARSRRGGAAVGGVDGRIPTLQEVVDLARTESRRLGRRIGIMPEIKNPAYFAAAGLPVEPRLVALLRRDRLTAAASPVPVEVQSFDPDTLRQLHSDLPVRLVQLVGATPPTVAQLAAFSGYANAVAVDRPALSPDLVTAAHQAGLALYAYTFGPADPVDHYLPAWRTGVDGLFSDLPDLAAAGRNRAAEPVGAMAAAVAGPSDAPAAGAQEQ
ncbi:MAG: glycerophosphodiester phosphodiesterase family protein [Mycobacteriales bacterium]